jgi:hypothetical protein
MYPRPYLQELVVTGYVLTRQELCEVEDRVSNPATNVLHGPCYAQTFKELLRGFRFYLVQTVNETPKLRIGAPLKYGVCCVHILALSYRQESDAPMDLIVGA